LKRFEGNSTYLLRTGLKQIKFCNKEFTNSEDIEENLGILTVMSQIISPCN